MAFNEIIRDIINALDLTQSEFLSATGLKRGNLDWWENNPDLQPQPKTLRRIRQALGLEFETDEKGQVVGWKKQQEPATGLYPKPDARPYRVKEVMEPNGDRHAELVIPESAREFYESFEFHGGKIDWLELDEESRSFYENIHSLLLHSIDSLNERFAAGLRELRAARERELRAALEEFEKTFRKRMIGLLGN